MGLLPNTPSTISWSDLYGGNPPAWKSGDEPAEKDAGKASGLVTKFDMNRPLVYWTAFIGMLIAIRYLWEKGS